MDIPATETKNEGAEMIDLNELKKKAYEYSRKRAENGGTKPLNTFHHSVKNPSRLER